jgi:hypothetical protein
MSLLFSQAHLPHGLVEFVIPRLEETLVERVLQIVKFWGEDEGVDMERVVEVASRLYGSAPSEVVEALIENLRAGSVSGSFVVKAEALPAIGKPENLPSL